MSPALALPESPAILVITLRRLGDVLLTTPLTRSLRRAYPRARIDMLVFAGTEGILKDNPDIDTVITVRPKPGFGEQLTLLRRIGLRYDLAIATHPGDRPTALALASSFRRVGLAPESGGGSWWKQRVFDVPVPVQAGNHRVNEVLRLVDALGIERHPEVVCPRVGVRQSFLPPAPYAVVHAHPMFRYRRWTDAGWHALAAGLVQRGLHVVATGGPDPQESAYLDALWNGAPVAVERLDGCLDWPQLTALLRSAAVYVGTDTSVTHLAAASGCPTVALFGPTDPRLWGPWPSGGLDEMWAATGAVQQRGNVFLVQQTLPCTPCQREGCERHLDSGSACLEQLTITQVLGAVDRALPRAPARTVALRA